MHYAEDVRLLPKDNDSDLAKARLRLYRLKHVSHKHNMVVVSDQQIHKYTLPSGSPAVLQNWRVGCTMAAPECCQDYYSCLLHAVNQVSVAFLLISAVITKSYPYRKSMSWG